MTRTSRSSTRVLNTPPTNWQPVRKWNILRPGDFVEVWSIDTYLYLAFVDDLSEDGQTIWLVEDGTGSRRLFIRGDAITLYRPAELARLVQM